MIESESPQSLGGLRRKESLSAERRSEIAAAGAAARWGFPKATHEDKPITIGGHDFPCAVLEGGIRVLSERAVTKALGGKRGGHHWQRMKDGGAELPLYLSANNLKPFISEELLVALKPIVYVPCTGGTAHGVRAELLPKVCKVLLHARRAGKLHWRQEEIAKQAEILQEGLAEVGIVALVDAATGYDKIRDQLALQEILNRYLTDEYAKWSRMFEPEFYKELFRLKGVPYPPKDGSTRKPLYVGHWTNDIVYSRLAPGIREHLRRVNPKNAAGRKARKDHQHFTRDYGHPALKEHLSNVTFLMKACGTDVEFRKKLDAAAPKMGETIPLDLGEA